MEKIKNLKYWQVALISLGLGLLCHLVFGWSFWAIALIIHFIYAAEKVSRWLYVLAFAGIIWIAIGSFFPQTSSKGTWALLKADLFTAKAVDSVQVKADVILEAEKNRQKEAALGEYTRLLKDGKIQQARRLLDSIDRAFSDKPSLPPPVKKIDSVPLVTPPSSSDTIFLNPGTHYFDMKKGEKSPQYHINSDAYCVTTTDNVDRVELVYPNFGILRLWQDQTLPNEYDFYILALRDQRVKIKVY